MLKYTQTMKFRQMSYIFLLLVASVVHVAEKVGAAQGPMKARPFCLEGYVLDTSNALCVKNLKQSFTLVCPQNCEFDASGTCSCVEELKSEQSCPPGFTLDALQKNCTTVVETPAMPSCALPNQKLLNDKCTGVTVMNAEFVCPAPSVLKGDLCIQEDYTPTSEECPPGYELNHTDASFTRSLQMLSSSRATSRGFLGGRTGGRKTSEDDDDVPGFFDSERKKPFGINVGGGGVLRSTSLLGMGQHSSTVAHDSVTTFSNNSEFPQITGQPSNFTGNNTTKVCIKRNVTSPRPSCPPNHRLEKDVCVSEIVEPVDMACENGFHYDAATQNCVRESLGPSVSECPNGYRSEGRQCVSTEVEEPQRSCREGFVYEPMENLCVKVLKEAPRYKCASPDYYFDGHNCEKNLSVVPTLTCPSGRLLGDACLTIESKPGTPACGPNATMDKEQMKCMSSSVAPVKYTCSQGELTDERTCVSKTTAKARLACPDGYDMKGDTCSKEKTFQPVQACPHGSSLVGSDCLAHTETEPTYSCSAGFELRRDKCVMAKRVAPLQACSPGYTPYKERCIRQTRRSGQITCPDSFIYDGTQCVINDHQRPVYVCPENYSLEDDQSDMCVPQASHAAAVFNTLASDFPVTTGLHAAATSGLDDKKKTGLQIMALARRKPQLLAAF